MANSHDQDETVKQAIWNELSQIADPCIALSGRDLSIVDLGLVNEVLIQSNTAIVSVTLTDITCLNSDRIFEQIENIAVRVSGIFEVIVAPQSYPLWTEDRLSAKAQELFANEAQSFWPAAS